MSMGSKGGLPLTRVHPPLAALLSILLHCMTAMFKSYVKFVCLGQGPRPQSTPFLPLVSNEEVTQVM